MGNKLVLIDGHSILNRAFYGIPELTNSEGLHTNAVLGFLNIMLKIVEEEKADYLTVAFDVKHPTFRHDMYEGYKGTRKPMPTELHEQVPIIKDILKAMGITIIEKPGYEADDILGTIAKQGEQNGYEVSLVSGDRDLLQIASEHIKIRIPKTKRGVTEIEDYNTQDVIDKYGVTPSQIIDLKGLMGDASDNIPGVPGIGEKTAAKIIGEFHSIEEAYENIDNVTPNKARESLRENYNLATLSKVLATIKIDCPLDFHMEDAKIGDFYNEETFLLMKRLEFKSLLNRFEKNFSHNDNLEELFQVVEDIKTVDNLFKEIIMSKNSYVGCQFFEGTRTKAVEQYSLFDTNTKEESILGLSLGYTGKNQEEKIYYIKTSEDITGEYLIGKVKELLQTGIKISVIELKSQLGLLNIEETDQLLDCGVAAYLLNPLKASYFYDDIARDFLGLTVPSYKELLGKQTIQEASDQEDKNYYVYGCYMSYIAYKAYPNFMEQLQETNMDKLFWEVEMPLVYTLYDMECRGIMVNREELKSYGNRLAERIVKLEKDIYDAVGESFNINSPKQLGVILFEKLKLPFGKKTKTGYSTSADVLEKLKCEDPVVEMILEYRQLTKLKSTYADGLANYIDDQDRRIHGKFNQTIAATGRISSTEPNLQNIPIRMELGREIRKVFIPKEGYVFLDADYSQIELRVLAHMSGDERLISAYQEEQDIHKITASQVFHTPLDQVTSAQRSNAKAVNFGIVYGISSFGLGQDLNITRKEAEGYINKYFETYPRVKSFLDELVVLGKEKGYVTTLFHRRRPVPELSSSNFMQRSFGERVAMNSPIQGTAADIIKIAMIRVNQTLKKQQLKSSLILQIHDELLIETHKDEIEQVKQIIKEEMYHAASLSVPLEVDVNQGDNWYEAK